MRQTTCRVVSGAAGSRRFRIQGVARSCRPVLHYRLHDERNGGGSVIGNPGEALADLLHNLILRYGQRRALESVREAFEGGRPSWSSTRVL